MEFVKVEIITNEIKMDALMAALTKYKITGMTMYKAMGCGVQYGTQEYEAEQHEEIRLLEKNVVMLVLPKEHVEAFVLYIEKELYTGHIGDGKIFVSDIQNIYRIRTGEEGSDALMAGKN